MYTVYILSKPNDLTKSIYREMHKDTIPDNISWVGYSNFLDLSSVKEDFKAHGRKIVFDPEPFNNLAAKLNIKNTDDFNVAVIERRSDGVTGYIGTLRNIEQSEITRRLIRMSSDVNTKDDLPYYINPCLKKITDIDHSFKYISEARLELLSIIPGLSLYVLGQRFRALVLACFFIFWLSMSVFTTVNNYSIGDTYASYIMTFVAYFLTPLDCYNCADLTKFDTGRLAVYMIILPASVIFFAVWFRATFSILYIIAATIVMIYSILTVSGKLNKNDLDGYKIIHYK